MSQQLFSPQGSVFGGILLITGCCIGAGMLGLPVLSAEAGFLPSLAMLVLSWLFMAATGLAVLEVNLWFKQEVSIVSMAGKTLGKPGQAVSWIGFLFLFYALMVAYIAGSGQMTIGFLNGYFSLALPEWAGSLGVSLVFGLFVYLGTRAVDLFNRALMGGLIATYLLLVFLGLPHVNFTYLAHRDLGAAGYVLPVMIISFGFHNLVPSLTAYLGQDAKRLRLAILVGSALPLFIYLLWEIVILGLVPLEGADGLRQALKEGVMVTEVLSKVSGAGWAVQVAEYFAFFALITSFLGVALSFVDFLADGLGVPKDVKGKIGLCSLVVVPPFIFALIYPHIFLQALNYAGGFGAVVLFGILPALMIWKGRYSLNIQGQRLLPGGKPVLILVIAFAAFIFLLQLSHAILGV